MSKLKICQLNSIFCLVLLSTTSLILKAEPANAHHPFGNETPSNFFEGFLSGLGHPVIGLDHLTFVVAVGLMAALKGNRGIFIPLSFIFATLVGTGVHLLSLNLPLTEIIISASVLIFGILLALKQSPSIMLLIGLTILAGVFHGYAYGEAIIGAEMTPLVSYLSGFALIQFIIALIAYQLGQFTLNSLVENPSLRLRFAGFTICGLGVAFLSSVLGL